jgi:hypothetical protein
MKRTARLVCVALLLGVGFTTSSSATHSWGGYHWARTSNPFNIKVGDNVGAAWDAYLDKAVKDWNGPTVLSLTKVAGSTSHKNCRPKAGRIEVCADRYGATGWLGIAQIWVSGKHITQATTKLNDTYFNTATYNKAEWRQLVVCQEIAHDFGLDHQDEAFNNANLGSCMDYTNNRWDRRPTPSRTRTTSTRSRASTRTPTKPPRSAALFRPARPETGRATSSRRHSGAGWFDRSEGVAPKCTSSISDATIRS